jgi:Flp pilus assembly pilin Flp
MPAGPAHEPPAGMASNEIQGGPVLVLTSGTPREQGVTAVEYALMVAIIAVLLLGAFYALFNTVLDRYSSVATCRRQRSAARRVRARPGRAAGRGMG